MKTYAIVGAGVRATSMFAKPLVQELREHAKLVGICDVNRHRAEEMGRIGEGIPVFTDFDDMLHSAKPDAVIVTTPDSIHHEYIIRSLEAGCDAISEKPMTTDADKCRAILEAERRTGRKVTVTFNCRFMPYVARVKELLDEGVIGTIQSVNLEWHLDRIHGADYFRRWHRRMENSGGLLVHKSTHHFDMVNWWLNDEPDTVFAFGSNRFYGPNRERRGERCLSCGHGAECEFYYDIRKSGIERSLYYEAEHLDGYYRDQCVFGDDIDIYDTASVNVKYAKGALLTYSLTAYNPMEGWKATFIGSKGRLEAADCHRGAGSENPNQYIHVYNTNGEKITTATGKAQGGHGGGDHRLRRMIFVGDVKDTLGQQAGSREGAMSMMIGAAANLSIAHGRAFSIPELLRQPAEALPAVGNG